VLDYLVDHADDPTVPSRSDWIDEASHLSKLDPSGADQIDADHEPRDLALAGER
jgi:hypothetical protein